MNSSSGFYHPYFYPPGLVALGPDGQPVQPVQPINPEQLGPGVQQNGQQNGQPQYAYSLQFPPYAFPHGTGGYPMMAPMPVQTTSSGGPVETNGNGAGTGTGASDDDDDTSLISVHNNPSASQTNGNGRIKKRKVGDGPNLSSGSKDEQGKRS